MSSKTLNAIHRLVNPIAWRLRRRLRAWLGFDVQDERIKALSERLEGQVTFADLGRYDSVIVVAQRDRQRGDYVRVFCPRFDGLGGAYDFVKELEARFGGRRDTFFVDRPAEWRGRL